MYQNRVKVSAITNSSEHLQPGLSGCRCNLQDARCSSGPYKDSECSPLIGQSLCPLIGQSNMFTVYSGDIMLCIAYRLCRSQRKYCYSRAVCTAKKEKKKYLI